MRYDLKPKPRSPRPSHPKNRQEQIDFQEGPPGCLSGLKAKANRPVHLFCQDECRFGLMPVTRHRITLPGVKPMQEAKPGCEYFYLYGAVGPEAGQRFFTEHERLHSDCFQRFLDRFAEAFPSGHNILVLDSGRFHKVKKLSIPRSVRTDVSSSVQPRTQSSQAALAGPQDYVLLDLCQSPASLRQKVRRALAAQRRESPCVPGRRWAPALLEIFTQEVIKSSRISRV